MTAPLNSQQAWGLLDTLPLGVIVTDGKKVLWLNASAEQLTGLNAAGVTDQPLARLPEWLATALVEGGEHARLSGEAGCQVLISVKTFSDTPPLQACFLSEASQTRQLQQQVAALEQRIAALDTRDHASGLLNRRGLRQVLEAQVSRSRRYANPLSVISLRIEDYGVNAARKADVMAAMGYLFNDRLRWADSVGHYDEDEFILVLPETEAAAAASLAVKLTDQLRALLLPHDELPVTLTITRGVATWQDGDDPTRLLQRCRAQMD